MTIATPRFTALDVFRGLAVCFMIIVNTPGNEETIYSSLQHAKWHGFTPADLVFPSFLFAMGNALSFIKNQWNTLTQSQVLWKIMKRAVIIFLLGYLMNWFPFVERNKAGKIIPFPFKDTRVFGVLQRIALCYDIVAVMVYYLKPKTMIILTMVFLLAYWLLAYLLGDAVHPLSLQGNAIVHIDIWLLGKNHLYHDEGVAFDPEGLLSTMPALVNVIAGYWVGNYIQQKQSSYKGLTILLLSGIVLLFLAYCWNFSFPINKNLWTSSFVLLTVGLDCIILAALVYIIGGRRQKKWTYFFEVLGRNPLFIYILAELSTTLLLFFQVNAKITVYEWLYIKIFRHTGSYFGSFLFAILFMLACWLVGYVLDKRKIYLRI